MKTKTLSPAAQAVLDAATSVKHPEIETVAFQCSRLEIAAALRAAADQVVPEPSDLDKKMLSIAALRRRWIIRDQLLAIASELEG